MSAVELLPGTFPCFLYGEFELAEGFGKVETKGERGGLALRIPGAQRVLPFSD
jgi:hypothetical protein